MKSRRAVLCLFAAGATVAASRRSQAQGNACKRLYADFVPDDDGETRVQVPKGYEVERVRVTFVEDRCAVQPSELG